MKIVQSFWSKPIHQESSAIQNRSNGGWLHRKYNYISWAYSCLQFKKFYDDVVLITDSPGKELLIDILELPYNNYSTELDAIKDYDAGLWALGKLHAYKLQNDPFIHADGDVVIWKRFDKNLEQSDIIVQNKDEDFEFYHDTIEEILEHFSYIPKAIVSMLKKDDNKIHAINAGIIGGTKIDFFKEYVNEALLFVNKNTNCLNKVKIGKFNTVFEQYLFSCMARKRCYDITCLFEANVIDYKEFVDIINIPKKSTYFHPVGLFKKEAYLCRELEYRFREAYPNYYFHIHNLLKKRLI